MGVYCKPKQHKMDKHSSPVVLQGHSKLLLQVMNAVLPLCISLCSCLGGLPKGTLSSVQPDLQALHDL